MTRDKRLYYRALRLHEMLSRRYRLGKISGEQYVDRCLKLSQAHARAQRAAGAADCVSKHELAEVP